MRTEKFISGIALLGLAVLLVLSKLSIVSFHFRIWTVIFTIFLGYTLIRGLIHRRLTESIFSIAFLCILYASQLGIQKLGTWTILATALLINIGLSMIFHSFFKQPFIWSSWSGKASLSNQTVNSNETVIINQRLASGIRYIKSENLQQVRINLVLASFKLYFDQTKMLNQPATIVINGTLSELKLYLPESWDILIDNDNMLSEVKEENKPANKLITHHLTIKGNLTLSEIKIIYI